VKTIRALRQERGWTQFELALRVGVQPQTVYLWERGRRLPHVPQLRRLGAIFGLCSDAIDLGPLEERTRRPPPPADPAASGAPTPHANGDPGHDRP
jgi:transcriptional regulator with XRE-family HTH domain